MSATISPGWKEITVYETSLLRDNVCGVELPGTEQSFSKHPWDEEGIRKRRNTEFEKVKSYKMLQEVNELDPFGLGVLDVKMNKELLFVSDASTPSVLPAETPGPPTLTKEPNHNQSLYRDKVQLI